MFKLQVLLVAVLIAGTFGNPEKQPEQEKESLQFITSTPYSEPTPVTSKPATKSVVVTSKPTTKPAYPQTRYPQPLYRRNQYINKSYSKVEYCDPRSPPKCVKNVNETFCLKDTEYPEKEVQYALQYDPLLLKKYAEVAVQSADNLVDGVTSLGEKHFDYSLYNGKPFAKGNWIGGEGYICPSDVVYARPVRAQNVKGEWRVIVQNIAYYTQTQRLETCLYPGASCRTLAPCHRSECIQKFVHHRMLSFDPCDSQRGLFIDIYKLPAACSCKLPSKFF